MVLPNGAAQRGGQPLHRQGAARRSIGDAGEGRGLRRDAGSDTESLRTERIASRKQGLARRIPSRRFASVGCPSSLGSAVTEPRKHRWLLAGRELFSMLSVRSREVSAPGGARRHAGDSCRLLRQACWLRCSSTSSTARPVTAAGVFGTLLYRTLDALGLPVTLLSPC